MLAILVSYLLSSLYGRSVLEQEQNGLYFNDSHFLILFKHVNCFPTSSKEYRQESFTVHFIYALYAF